MKILEIRDLNIEQIKKLIAEKQTQAVKMRFDIAARRIKNHREFRMIKKDIARAMTVLKQREQ